MNNSLLRVEYQIVVDSQQGPRVIGPGNYKITRFHGQMVEVMCQESSHVELISAQDLHKFRSEPQA